MLTHPWGRCNHLILKIKLQGADQGGRGSAGTLPDRGRCKTVRTLLGNESKETRGKRDREPRIACARPPTKSKHQSKEKTGLGWERGEEAASKDALLLYSDLQGGYHQPKTNTETKLKAESRPQPKGGSRRGKGKRREKTSQKSPPGEKSSKDA